VLGRKALRRITQPVLAPEVTFQLEVSFVVLVVPSLRIIYIIVYRINVSGLNFVNEKNANCSSQRKKDKKRRIQRVILLRTLIFCQALLFAQRGCSRSLLASLAHLLGTNVALFVRVTQMRMQRVQIVEALLHAQLGRFVVVRVPPLRGRSPALVQAKFALRVPPLQPSILVLPALFVQPKLHRAKRNCAHF